MQKAERVERALVEAIGAYRSQRYAEAEAAVDRIQAAVPRHAGCQQLKALLALLRGDLEAARIAIRISLAVRPGHGPALKIAKQVIDAQFAAADVLRLGRDAALAISAYRFVLQLDSGHAEAWFGLGLALQDRHDYVAAAEAFAHVVSLRPRDYKAIVNHGISLQQSGNLERAFLSYRSAFQIEPSSFGIISQALTEASTGFLILDLQRLRDLLSAH